MPISMISVQGQQLPSGYYTGLVTISVSASDGKTGIYKTESSLDKGTTWQVYQQEFSVTAEETPQILARSIDLAGNQEYPWMVRLLKPFVINLPLIYK